MDERLEEERMEQVRKEIIEQERVKLLQEHAHRLLGHLPKVNNQFSSVHKLFLCFRGSFEMRKIWTIWAMILDLNFNDNRSMFHVLMDGFINPSPNHLFNLSYMTKPG